MKPVSTDDSSLVFQIRQCTKPDCRFRFPVVINRSTRETCPRCGSPVIIVANDYINSPVKALPIPATDPEIEVLLDNIRSIFNVGSMIRTADGAGIKHVHLCGITPTPDQPKVAKTALGAEIHVPWTHHPNGLQAAQSLKQKGYRLWALEGGQKAKSLYEILTEVDGSPILLITGNELSGIDPGIMAECDQVVSIPMMGVKQSLNVAIAFGIAIYTLRYGHSFNSRSIN